jgi:hypothetical protein
LGTDLEFSFPKKHAGVVIFQPPSAMLDRPAALANRHPLVAPGTTPAYSLAQSTTASNLIPVVIGHHPFSGVLSLPIMSTKMNF